MKERPILFSGPMVRALLAGTKTQTRRIVKPQPDSRPGMECTRVLFKNRKGDVVLDEAAEAKEPRLCAILCPYGQPGDRLWVREAWAETRLFQASGTGMVVYREDDNRTDYGGPWKPSIHMRRRDSRILLEITAVRVERLQDISDTDAIAEGIERDVRLDPAGTCHWRVYGAEQGMGTNLPGASYLSLWEQINGPGSWLLNPWVWVVEFKRVQQASSGRPSQLEDAPCSA